ncbi:dioxygenase [Nitriliruptoraceae bacterium ZYF776]|nr:dioxygenase [Profundirhabdus halotolerans]
MSASPAIHPFDQHLLRAAGHSADQPVWTPEDGPLPALYVSHGAPPLFEDAGWMDDLFGWASSLPKPRAILIVSAHWEAAPLMITSPEASTPLVYDFGGFDPRYYEMTYATPDASALAQRVAGAVAGSDGGAGHGPLYQHPNRGLDHGAWVPLKVMYPNADVPVLQLSLPTSDPEALIALGERLRPLREEGVLVIGSGFMTHGLPFITRADMQPGATPPGWSSDFDDWVADALARGDVDTLMRYDRAPGMPYAHPTADHYVPLFVTLGAADDPEAPVTTALDGYMWGFSRRSFQAA